MKLICFSLAAFSFLAWMKAVAAGAGAATSNNSIAAMQPASNEVSILRLEWVDSKRNRKVPVKIYFPKKSDKPLPVIIFSHGLGGTREGYEYLGKYWAGHGYVSVHLQHIGSDDAVWREAPSGEFMPAMRRAASNPDNFVNRPLDVSFAIDQLAKLNEEDASLKHRLDLDRIGLAGHSFGAYTTLAAAGEVFVTSYGTEFSAREPRIKAAIAMSAPAQKNKDYDLVFSKIKIPIFHMTGTLDDSPIGDTKAADRRIPFDHINGADQYLLIFNGGDHMVFSGRPRDWGNGEKDAEFQKDVCICSTAFWDAYLKNETDAKAWLTDGGAQKVLKEDGTFTEKLKSHASAQGR
ncbi:MAG TPA: hypothetical protein VFB72_19580 [Verrucomicrobiae bacterium]|nr:hypothetical protein [Verrucomicrobiae bacterium]